MRLLPKDPDMGWTPYVWLVYAGFFLAYPILRNRPAVEVALAVAGLLVFLVLYFAGFWLRDRRIIWCAVGILLLGVLFVPSNAGASCFFIYAAAFFGSVHPPRLAVILIGGVLVVVSLESWWLDLPVYVWAPAAFFSVVIGGVNIHDASVIRTNAKLRVTQEEVARLAKTAERERIARDLHDLLGHTLSLVTLKAELAGKLVRRDPERAEAEIKEVERISRDALREVRTAITGYRSEGLQAEMARARLALEAAGVRLEYFARPVELGPAEETVLCLALREAVTNVMRHSRAQTCRISVEEEGGEIRLEVRDDGRGGTAPEGVGLSVMRERVEGLGGRMERSTDGGTVILVALPRRTAVTVAG